MSEVKKVEGIALSSVIQVEIGGGMYSRIQSLLLHYSQQKPLDEFTRVLQSIKDKESSDVYSYHLETLLVLVDGIETAAKSQGKITVKDLPTQP